MFWDITPFSVYGKVAGRGGQLPVIGQTVTMGRFRCSAPDSAEGAVTPGQLDRSRASEAVLSSDITSIDSLTIASRKLLYVPNASRFPTDLAELYSLDDFLSLEECAAFVSLMTRHLRPSAITTPDYID